MLVLPLGGGLQGVFWFPLCAFCIFQNLYSILVLHFLKKNEKFKFILIKYGLSNRFNLNSMVSSRQDHAYWPTDNSWSSSMNCEKLNCSDNHIYIIFLNTLFSGIILDLQRICKDSTEFPGTQCPLLTSHISPVHLSQPRKAHGYNAIN